jgi:hypothetical protein
MASGPYIGSCVPATEARLHESSLANQEVQCSRQLQSRGRLRGNKGSTYVDLSQFMMGRKEVVGGKMERVQ